MYAVCLLQILPSSPTGATMTRLIAAVLAAGALLISIDVGSAQQPPSMVRIAATAERPSDVGYGSSPPGALR